jgi:hypothetical protein
MNLQVAATLCGRVAAIGPLPVPGARHDAHAYATSGLKDLLAGRPAAADLGYLGVDGITIVPFRTPPGGHLHDTQAAFNKDLSAIRAAAERAVASVKTWRILSERPLPRPDQQIPRAAHSGHRAVLLQQLLQGL